MFLLWRYQTWGIDLMGVTLCFVLYRKKTKIGAEDKTPKVVDHHRGGYSLVPAEDWTAMRTSPSTTTETRCPLSVIPFTVVLS